MEQLNSFNDENVYIKIPEENMLAHKKALMHRINRYVYSQGAISKEIFENTKEIIEKLEK